MSTRQCIMLLQGSFNPVTLAHINALESAYRYLSEVGYNITERMVVPTSDKYEWKTLESDKHRTEMLRHAVGSTGITVSDMETKQNRWIRTAEVMELFKKQNPDKEILYLCGGDKVTELTTWDNPREAVEHLKRSCTIVCIGRDSFKFSDKLLESLGLDENFIRIPVTLTNISSTFVRDNISNTDLMGSYLNGDVLNYIRKHSLYV